MKYLITERQYRLLLEENIYPSEEEYRQALKDVEDLIREISMWYLTTDMWGKPRTDGYKPKEVHLIQQVNKIKQEVEDGSKFQIDLLKSRAQTEKHKNAADVIFNYHEKFEDIEKSTIDITNQCDSGEITHKAKPGEYISCNDNISGYVYLTTDNHKGYHGGLFDDVVDFIENKRGGLYLTKSIAGAWGWPGVSKKPIIRRVYEVIIKKNSLFINRSPAAADQGSASGLWDEKNVLLKLGIDGMADKNYRFGTHEKGEGTTGSEALVVNSNVIQNIRVVPFKELLGNEEIKSKYGFNKFEFWYENLRWRTIQKYFLDDYENFQKIKLKEKGIDQPGYLDLLEANYIDEYCQTNEKVDEIIEKYSNKEIMNLSQNKGW